jgi:hypothetical protein
MTDRRHRETHKMPASEWPSADAAAWHQACHPRPGPFSPHKPRSPHTYCKYAKGWGIYLRYLQTQGQLDPAETPAYSPDLNPMEQVFAKLKALRRKAAKRSIDALWRPIGELLDEFDA